MITALFRLFHLLDRWRSERRAARWPETDRWMEADRLAEPSSPEGRSSRQTSSVARRRRSRSNPVPYLRAVSGDIGMTTAEYAVGTVAAVAFAVVLFKVVQSPAVHSALAAVVTGALSVHL